MANQWNVDDARFINMQHLPATSITWKEKDNTQYARARQGVATPRKLEDARFIKNQQCRSSLRLCRSSLVSRSLSLSLSLSLARSLLLSLTLSVALWLSLCLALCYFSLLSFALRALFFALHSLSLARSAPSRFLPLSCTHFTFTAIHAPNCECTENLTCMTQQSSTEETPLHSASPKGSVDGKHCEKPAHSFSADGKRQAIPEGVDLSLDPSPSCPHPMSLMAMSRVSLSLSCSLSLSFAYCLSLSLSVSLSLPHTISFPFVLSLCVCLALCSFSLALYPDACKLHIAVAVQGFHLSLDLSRLCPLLSLSLIFCFVCLSISLSVSLSHKNQQSRSSLRTRSHSLPHTCSLS